MIKCFIFGITGRMGQEIASQISGLENYLVAGGYAKSDTHDTTYPVYTSIADIDCDFDVVIDFSSPASLGDLSALLQRTKKPAVIATTGYTDADQQRIRALANIVPIFQSSNMSTGIQLIMQMIEDMMRFCADSYDVEIIEKHHNQKKDSPSGTALMLADRIREFIPLEPIFGRGPDSSKRSGNELGIHAVRGGSIVGDHEILLSGRDETISVSHSAQSRRIFASGALKAAEFILTKNKGLYHNIE